MAASWMATAATHDRYPALARWRAHVDCVRVPSANLHRFPTSGFMTRCEAGAVAACQRIPRTGSTARFGRVPEVFGTRREARSQRGSDKGRSGGDGGLPRPQLGVGPCCWRDGGHALRDAPRPWKVWSWRRVRRGSRQRRPRAGSVNPAWIRHHPSRTGIAPGRCHGPHEESAGQSGALRHQRPGRGCATSKAHSRRLLLIVQRHQADAPSGKSFLPERPERRCRPTDGSRS